MKNARRDGAAQTVTMPPTDIEAVRCRCGAYYLDAVGGRAAHDVVFGHQPQKKEDDE